MIKPMLVCAALSTIVGCTQHNTSQPENADKRPPGLVKMLQDGEGGTYADMRIVSAHKGNTQLRQMYLINNYAKSYVFQKDPLITIQSSRVINVFNCDTHERAQFERIYFTQRWAEGDKVFKREAIGQWKTYPQESLIGIIAAAVCKIDPTHLKPEPAVDTETQQIGE